MTIGKLLRTGLVYSSMAGGTAVLTPFITVCALAGRMAGADAAIRLWSRALMACSGVRYEVLGTGNAAGIGPCVILSSHRSHLDGPLLLCALPFDFAFVIKRSLARIPVWGFGVTRAGYVAIDRHDRADSVAGFRRAAASVRAGRRVLVFPEGTRSKTDEFLPFKKGGAVLAIEAGVPVLPVAIAGTQALLPSGSFSGQPGPAVVAIGAPIPTTGMTYEDHDRLLAQAEAEIRRLYGVAKARLAERTGTAPRSRAQG